MEKIVIEELKYPEVDHLDVMIKEIRNINGIENFDCFIHGSFPYWCSVGGKTEWRPKDIDLALLGEFEDHRLLRQVALNIIYLGLYKYSIWIDTMWYPKYEYFHLWEKHIAIAVHGDRGSVPETPCVGFMNIRQPETQKIRTWKPYKNFLDGYHKMETIHYLNDKHKKRNTSPRIIDVKKFDLSRKTNEGVYSTVEQIRQLKIDSRKSLS
tara:strand:+ start:426 stop:1055 length:630 start_codon:yes stop_codon:yes gene_type:complete